MSTFRLNISSPDGVIFSGEAVRIILRGTEGELAVLAGHVPFITSVVSGRCELLPEDGTLRNGHTEGGLLTVARDGVTYLTSELHWLEDEA